MPESLEEIARRCDAAVAAARRELVSAVRRAHAAGMTQDQIGVLIGRSQPEVNRLLRFHGSTDHARALRGASAQIRAAVRAAGGRHVRVFGSVARDADSPDSDIDLLFDMRRPLSLMELSALERHLSRIVGAHVDLVPEQALRPDLRDTILHEAIAL